MPMWKVSAYIGANLIVMEELWEGLWMDCYRQIDRMQCKVYDSMLSLPPELQAARGLMCVSIVLVITSLFVTGCGTKSNCYGDNIKGKNTTLALGGSLYLLTFLTTLIPVSLVGYTVISKFYNPLMVDAEKRELGKALFLGWLLQMSILLITGIILLFSYSKRRSKEEEPYTDAYLMLARDEQKGASTYTDRTPSSFHKPQEYV